MSKLSGYQKDYLYSLLQAGLHEVTHTIDEYLDLETNFSDVKFEELPELSVVDNDEESVSVHIVYKGTNIGEGACFLLKRDLKLLANQLSDGEDIGNKYEFMVDVAKEFTNLVCNRLLGIIDDQFSLTHSSCVPVYREPLKPIRGQMSEGPYGLLSTRLFIGATKISCQFNLVIRPLGLDSIVEKIPEPRNNDVKIA
ncbi:hypothetical protein [Pseudobacteriovorax antillogorgiicola]|uniref:Chemotaxis protein CheY-P-specific phosphatase CheC n=1 Tax=Pseudobacteriovorax antillogorgiicola TaxID=1513793 RepID=A0A1Y6CN10_9BACT|nr:hypothetical protein [Pseudobacteriovorax antillogorgiicola]TCS45015.1 chemotaxis protein CheY-P-specific phosphatase CheC [Pseudobacteriovorax antillogorgiicola]SMF76356.1 Chemotaxis protein CheY-P-specific phosphatase CheC [Pseudobacteriovorax antillogorgiicola]